jgi:hypothetical protein
MDDKQRIDEAIARLSRLSRAQIGLVNEIIDTFEQPITVERLPASDVASNEFMVAFGDVLKLHHSLSKDYLDKHRFEAAIEKVFVALNRQAARETNNNPGHDITVDGVAWSLKTQGDRGIKRETLHISKFMELGKGQWKTKGDLPGLRDRFLDHMKSYERIFQLRYFRLDRTDLSPTSHYYELVEIPKSVLQQSASGTFAMQHNSPQRPKPGYCTVTDGHGVMFKLYFDGGTERKLQIKHLRKDLCTVHGSWKF